MTRTNSTTNRGTTIVAETGDLYDKLRIYMAASYWRLLMNYTILLGKIQLFYERKFKKIYLISI